ETAGAAATKSNRKEWRLKTHLVHGADVFADEVDAVTGANRGAVMAEDIVGQPDARSEPGRVAIEKGGTVGGSAEGGHVEAVDAAGVGQRGLVLQVGQRSERADG